MAPSGPASTTQAEARARRPRAGSPRRCRPPPRPGRPGAGRTRTAGRRAWPGRAGRRTSRSSRRASAAMTSAARPGVGGGAVGDGLGEAADRGERGAQVVGHRHQELALQAPRPGQALGHGVDRVGQRRRLGVGPGRHRDLGGQVAGGDPAGRRLGRHQRPGDAPAQPVGDQRGGGQGEQRRRAGTTAPACCSPVGGLAGQDDRLGQVGDSRQARRRRGRRPP